MLNKHLYFIKIIFLKIILNNSNKENVLLISFIVNKEINIYLKFHIILINCFDSKTLQKQPPLVFQ